VLFRSIIDPSVREHIISCRNFNDALEVTLTGETNMDELVKFINF